MILLVLVQEFVASSVEARTHDELVMAQVLFTGSMGKPGPLRVQIHPVFLHRESRTFRLHE